MEEDCKENVFLKLAYFRLDLLHVWKNVLSEVPEEAKKHIGVHLLD